MYLFGFSVVLCYLTKYTGDNRLKTGCSLPRSDRSDGLQPPERKWVDLDSERL